MANLLGKQKRFVDEYLIDLNAHERSSEIEKLLNDGQTEHIN